ncbi:zinc finger, CCHC-type containing protein [Tanacetum coccineum]
MFTFTLTKKKPNLNYLRVLRCRAVVILLVLKLKTLGERSIECIFVGYAEHFKAFRFHVIEPNESISINSIIESKDVIFDENKFSSVPRPSQRSLINGTEDIGGTRDEVSNQHSYCFNVEDDPKTFDEAMKSQDIFKRKLKVDETIEKFKARLVIQGFRHKSGIEYFDTYAPVVRISSIRPLIALASIHNLIIHQMDVKTTFLNGEFDEEHAPKQCHQKFDKVVLSNGYLLNQADKCQQVSTPMDKSKKLMPNNGQAVSQLDIWKEFGRNTRYLGSFEKETDKIMDLHQNLLKIVLTERRDGVASITRRRHDLRSDDVSTLVMPSEHGRPKGTLDDSVSRD